MLLYQIKEIDVNKETIERDKLFNVFVFGLPRSGTSMMTHIVELLGVNMIHTSEERKEEAAKQYEKKYGEYHPNPTGFYEITDNQLLNFFNILKTPYSGCKMIIPVVGMRWQLVTSFPSKVIMMVRDVEEIRQSQMAYFNPQGVDTGVIKSMLGNQKHTLKDKGIDHLIVDYRDVLNNKEENVVRIAQFIRSDNGIDEVINFINPKQNRYKTEELVHGL